MENLEVLAIIPVRGGSKGIPGKNIKLLAGKPLVYYTIEAAKNSKYVTRTIVSTENPEIKKVALSYGAEVLDRPAELAQDETKTAPVMLQVLEELAKQNYYPDVVVLLQATCPLRDSKELDEAFKMFFDNEKQGCDSVFAGHVIGTTHSKWRKNPKTNEYECLFDYRNRPRRQDTDKHYEMITETGATYIIKTDVLKEIKDFIGKNPLVYLNGKCLDIDTAADFDKAAAFVSNPDEEKVFYEKD